MPDPARRGGLRPLPVHWDVSAHARRLLTLALAGLVLAVGTGRPEFAGLAAPSLLLLATIRRHRPAEMDVRVSVADSQLVERAESAVIADVVVPGGFGADLEVGPGAGIAAGPPVTLRRTDAGSATTLRSVRLPFTPQRWGSRQIGALLVTLRDPYRLTEGRVAVVLPVVECKPLPAQLARSVVLSRLPSRLGEHAACAARQERGAEQAAQQARRARGQGGRRGV